RGLQLRCIYHGWLVDVNGNWAQGLEGGIDSVHSDFLHSADITGRPGDHRPGLKIEGRPYGFRYAAIRRPDGDGQRSKYVRVTLFAGPCFVLIPPRRRGPDAEITTSSAASAG